MGLEQIIRDAHVIILNFFAKFTYHCSCYANFKTVKFVKKKEKKKKNTNFKLKISPLHNVILHNVI